MILPDTPLVVTQQWTVRYANGVSLSEIMERVRRRSFSVVR